MESNLLLYFSSSVRDVFDFSASVNLIAPLVVKELTVLSKNDMKQQECYDRELVQ
jgi:hypothetical protein